MNGLGLGSSDWDCILTPSQTIDIQEEGGGVDFSVSKIKCSLWLVKKKKLLSGPSIHVQNVIINKCRNK